MSAYRRIVAAVDFSACSAAALEQAARIASWNQPADAPPGKVDAVFAIEPVIYDLSAPVIMMPIPTPADEAGIAAHRWLTFAPAAHNREHIALHTPIGQPVGEVVHFARERKADLVVVGAHSSLDAARGVGSIASGIARAVPCPALIACESHRGPYRSVIAAIDFSPGSLSALEHAARFAAMDGSRLTLLHVFQDPWAATKHSSALAANMPDFLEKYRSAVIERLRQFGSGLKHELLALNATYDASQHQSHARGIVAYAKHTEADLVVIGAHGHSRLKEFIFGTTAERVVREAQTSVLIVR